MKEKKGVDSISQSLGALFLYAFLVILTGAAIFLGVISLLMTGEILSVGLAVVFIIGGSIGTFAAIKQIIKENNAHIAKAINYIKNNVDECYAVWNIDSTVWGQYKDLNKAEVQESKYALGVISALITITIIYLFSSSYFLSALGIVVGVFVYYLMGYVNKLKNDTMALDSDLKIYLHPKAILIGSKFINLALWGNNLVKVALEEENELKYILFHVERCTGETNVSQFIKIPLPIDVINQSDDLLKKYGQ